LRASKPIQVAPRAGARTEGIAEARIDSNFASLSAGAWIETAIASMRTRSTISRSLRDTSGPMTRQARWSRPVGARGLKLKSSALGPARHWRTAAADTTHPRVPWRSPPENRGRNRCLAARSLHSSRRRPFTLAVSAPLIEVCDASREVCMPGSSRCGRPIVPCGGDRIRTSDSLCPRRKNPQREFRANSACPSLSAAAGLGRLACLACRLQRRASSPCGR
jgi:hypothetical protein